MVVSDSTGVGSIVGMNNADVASLLGLEVLLVGNGGLGSTFDVLSLNQNLFNTRGVRVRAVILNKVCYCHAGCAQQALQYPSNIRQSCLVYVSRRLFRSKDILAGQESHSKA